MENLSKKKMAQVCFMLFGLFFGAGNLIFPPMLGQLAGEHAFQALLAFSITAVLLPIMGVIAVAKSQGLKKLASHVGPKFAFIFTGIIYLSIGPGLGIPRAASTPFEMAVAPYLPETFSLSFARFLYSTAFFLIAFWLCQNPNKMVARLGKFLTPLLIALIVLLFVGIFVGPKSGALPSSGMYQENSFVKGFLEGYNTMDAVAALNFGLVIALAVKGFGVKSEKAVVKLSIKAGVIAGSCLFVIYGMLVYIGNTTGVAFSGVENGAALLTKAAVLLFGHFGPLFLGIVFTLACLTTCVGLITSSSQYFANEKFSYKKWVFLWSTLSWLLANTGLNWLLKFSVPLLTAIYPVSLVLILFGCFLPQGKKWKKTYQLSVYVVGFLSVFDALQAFNLPFLKTLNPNQFLPFSHYSLGWVVPFLVATFIGLTVDTQLLQKAFAVFSPKEKKKAHF